MPIEKTLNPKVIQRILRFTRKILPLLQLAKLLSSISRRVSSFFHRIQFLVEWGVDNPEYFDHFLEQHYTWRKNRSAICWERGVLSSIALQSKLNPKVLEMCCGDGFNTYHFYSIHSSTITAIDFDEGAIKAARRQNASDNIKFEVRDIRLQLPEGPFDNIIWDAAIEHFTESEIENILKSVKSSLTETGILSGYTIIEPEDGGKHLHQHEREFRDKKDLADLLTPHFSNVHILETKIPGRSNLYFFASEGLLPFENEKNLIILK